MIAVVFLAFHPHLVNAIIANNTLIKHQLNRPSKHHIVTSMVLVLDIYGVLRRNNGIDQELLALIKELHENGIDVYLASNTSQEDADAKMALGNGTIKGTYCSETIGVGKPDQAFYHYICDDLGLIPAEILFFDDSQQNVSCAHQMGWHAYAFTSAQDVREKCNFHMEALKI